jgi:hypothetical protein
VCEGCALTYSLVKIIVLSLNIKVNQLSEAGFASTS